VFDTTYNIHPTSDRGEVVAVSEQLLTFYAIIIQADTDLIWPSAEPEASSFVEVELYVYAAAGV